jgi:predicted RNA-binding Zn-ribbon protein involved in translation (DUF1610 family)
MAITSKKNVSIPQSTTTVIKPAIVVLAAKTYKISCPMCSTLILDVSTTKLCKTYECPLCGKKFLFISEEEE